MRSRFTLLLVLLAISLGCSTEDQPTIDNNSTPSTNKPGRNIPQQNVVQNKAMLLKVDYLTHTFEGGKEFIFPNNPNFSLMWDYNSPGDFGSVTLMYAEEGLPIFEGTIIWMGLGAMSYPTSLIPASSFATGGALPMPNINSFQVMHYAETNYYPDPVPVAQIWDAIKNLYVVAQYRVANPDSPIRIFLYTPSVGVGNPADWDYFVLLKN